VKSVQSFPKLPTRARRQRLGERGFMLERVTRGSSRKNRSFLPETPTAGRADARRPELFFTIFLFLNDKTETRP
jgi:hypothetical protein